MNIDKPAIFFKGDSLDCDKQQRIIGPFFNLGTINYASYVSISEQFVTMLRALEELSTTEWFMDDGARPHCMNHAFRFLEDYFRNRIIALNHSNFTAAVKFRYAIVVL